MFVISGIDYGKFWLNSVSGVIIIIVELDCEVILLFNLFIKIMDSGFLKMFVVLFCWIFV